MALYPSNGGPKDFVLVGDEATYISSFDSIHGARILNTKSASTDESRIQGH